jgi:hypothetical protein
MAHIEVPRDKFAAFSGGQAVFLPYDNPVLRILHDFPGNSNPHCASVMVGAVSGKMTRTELWPGELTLWV